MRLSVSPCLSQSLSLSLCLSVSPSSDSRHLSSLPKPKVVELGVGTKVTRAIRWCTLGGAVLDAIIALVLVLFFNKQTGDWQIAVCEWVGVFLITSCIQSNVADMADAIELAVVGVQQYGHTHGRKQTQLTGGYEALDEQ